LNRLRGKPFNQAVTGVSSVRTRDIGKAVKRKIKTGKHTPKWAMVTFFADFS
jgi:hypothetical protein